MGRLLIDTYNIVFLRSVLRLVVTANVVSSSPILVTLMMEAIRSSKTSVLTRATWRNIPEDDILYFADIHYFWCERHGAEGQRNTTISDFQ
jgi:hypothetical protein